MSRRPVKRPPREELLAAAGRTVDDVIAPNLSVLFCGINPGLYTAYIGHHFAWPGNRFWPALHAGGFTDSVLPPERERELLDVGVGITNVAPRATATAAELTSAELVEGGSVLEAKVLLYRPRCLAVLGMGAYRTAFRRPKAPLGPQPERMGDTRVWVLPNPSGLNANYTPARLAELFTELRLSLEENR